MDREVVSVRDNVSVEALSQIMEWQNIRHLPVEGEKGALLGMISKTLIEENDFSPQALAREIMQREVIFVSPGYAIEDANVLMERLEIHCLPIVEDGMVVGMYTGA
jgi:CBS domain-containing protein